MMNDIHPTLQAATRLPKRLRGPRKEVPLHTLSLSSDPFVVIPRRDHRRPVKFLGQVAPIRPVSATAHRPNGAFIARRRQGGAPHWRCCRSSAPPCDRPRGRPVRRWPEGRPVLAESVRCRAVKGTRLRRGWAKRRMDFPSRAVLWHAKWTNRWCRSWRTSTTAVGVVASKVRLSTGSRVL